MTPEKINIRIPLIGESAPEFTAKTTAGNINFPHDFQGQYIILFSHPADFTPICSTEFMLFANLYKEFKALNTQIIGLSADSLYSHIAWLRTIHEKLEYKGLKHITVPFPVIVDTSQEIIGKYGMIHGDNDFPTRALFVIDPKGTIRASMFYPMYNGRNLEEVKRLLIAIQRHDKFAVATPANWHPGDQVIKRIPRTFEEANARMDTPDPSEMCYDWFSCFQADPEPNS
ncbi:MAG: peroxiredoxin [Promethearchaeota archaeon]